MEEHEEPLKESGKLRQLVFAIIVNLSSLSHGFMVGWQSPAIPQLQNPSPVVGSEPMTDDNISWMSSLICLTGTFMTIVFLVIPDKWLSRKKFGYVMTLPMILSWLLIIFATEHIHIYVAKGLSGITAASVYFWVPTYISEISSDSIRGILVSLVYININVGMLLGYIVGGLMSLYIHAVIGAIISALFLIAFIFVPESPVYLLRRNRKREAIRSLKWLKTGNAQTIEQKLLHLQLQIKKVASTRSANLSDLFRDRATIKGVIILLGLFICQQMCGICAVMNYTVTIFKMVGGSLSPNTSSIIVGAIFFLGSCLSMSLVERAGRRPLLLISSMGMCICHCMIGTFCYFQNLQYDVSAYGWIPVTALSTFMILFSFGLDPIPVVIMSEIFSHDVTSVASSVSLVICWATAFIMVKIFADLIALLGIHGCFFLFATFCACSFFFSYMLVPETKGRAREDIVAELNGDVLYKMNENVNIIGTDAVNAENV